jgi:hypothetical protein
MDQADEFVWVAVRVADGSGSYAEYRGQMAVEVFRRITINEMATGWFALESVVWERDREDLPQSVAGRVRGYGDISYFRVENLARIILLADSLGQKLRPRD